MIWATASWWALHKAGIEINRKVLADLAVNNQEAFKAIVDKVKQINDAHERKYCYNGMEVVAWKGAAAFF